MKWQAFTLSLLIGCSSATTSTPGPSTGANETTVAVSAKRFSFTPDVIHATMGQPIVIELQSTDRTHGFSLPDFGIRTDVKPGEVTRVRIVPDKTGTFIFHCDVFCGDGHEGMSGQFIVE